MLDEDDVYDGQDEFFGAEGELVQRSHGSYAFCAEGRRTVYAQGNELSWANGAEHLFLEWDAGHYCGGRSDKVVNFNTASMDAVNPCLL